MSSTTFVRAWSACPAASAQIPRHCSIQSFSSRIRFSSVPSSVLLLAPARDSSLLFTSWRWFSSSRVVFTNLSLHSWMVALVTRLADKEFPSTEMTAWPVSGRTGSWVLRWIWSMCLATSAQILRHCLVLPLSSSKCCWWSTSSSVNRSFCKESSWSLPSISCKCSSKSVVMLVINSLYCSRTWAVTAALRLMTTLSAFP